jgi:DNA polymerase III subunit alpha
VTVKPWDEKTQLMEEKTALGFFFSGHPYTRS